MAGDTNTSFDALLRELWPQTDIYDELFEGQPFLAMVPKDTEFYEKIRHIAVGYGTSQGLGADYAYAKANRSGNAQAEFKIQPVTYYSMFSVARQLIRRSRSKKAAILPALERAGKMAIAGWKRDMSHLVWGNGGGAIARLKAASSISSATFTLLGVDGGVGTVWPDARKFDVNMVLEFSSDDGTGGAGVRPGSVTVSGINYDTGVITCTGNITTGIPAAADSDYVFRQGNYNNVVQGVPAWITTADPSATTFNGLDRSKFPQKFAGHRIDARGLSPRNQLMYATKRMFEVNAKATHVFASPDDYFNLQVDLTTTNALQNVKDMAAPIGKYQFGAPFEGLTLMGSGGPIKVFPDLNVPVGYAYILQLDTWTLASMGEVPYFDMEDGNKILKETDADAYGGQMVGDIQLYCEAPFYNGVVRLA